MSADIHPLQPGGQPVDGERSVYLDAYLAPFRPWLDRDTVTEIMVNRPGEVWIEDAADPGMKRIETPQIDDRLLWVAIALEISHRHAHRLALGQEQSGLPRAIGKGAVA